MNTLQGLRLFVDIAAIVLLMVALPSVGGLACLPLRKGRSIAIPVAATSAAVIALSLALFLELRAMGVSAYYIESSEFDPARWIIALLDFSLMLFFFYAGIRLRNRLVTTFAVLQIAPLAFLEAAVLDTDIGPAVVIDYLAVVMSFVINIVGSVICLYAIKYMEHDKAQPRFFAMMLLFLGAMNGAVLANDMLWLFFFWEVTTFCSYVLIGHEGTLEAKDSAVRALVYTLGGGVAMAFGLVLTYVFFDTLSLKEVLVGEPVGGIALLPFALISIAAFTKSAQMPFQSWLLGAMVAPTPVSALLHSSTMVKLGVYMLIRISPIIGDSHALSWTIAFVGAISFLGTAVLAMTESNSKRVLAYSTIGNLGLVTMCVGINTSLAISAAMILIVFHALSKALMFMCVGVVKHELGTQEIDAMVGLRDRMPFVSVAFAIGVFTIMLPPFGMFASKWLISEAAISLPLLTFLIAIGFAATVVYYSKWLGRVLTAEMEAKIPSPLRDPISRVFRYTLGTLALGAVMLSFLVTWLVEHLINPYTEIYFGSSVSGDVAGIFSSLGEFPAIVLLAIVVAVFLLSAFLTRPREDELSTPYTGGEEYKFEIGGFYILDDLSKARFNVLLNLATTLLLVIIVSVPIAMEVRTWL
ncbi:MAG: NADH-quinone oxidoreductase subunit L [Thermoplasmata archaeon]